METCSGRLSWLIVIAVAERLPVAVRGGPLSSRLYRLRRQSCYRHPRRYEEWRSPGRHRELSHCRAPPGHGTTRVCRPRVRPIGTVCRCSVPKRIYPQIHEWRHRRGSRSVPENRQSGVGSGTE